MSQGTPFANVLLVGRLTDTAHAAGRSPTWAAAGVQP